MNAIGAGEEQLEWEPAPEDWDSSIKHYWQARHIKVVELAVTACGIPISHTKFAFAKGENNMVSFMDATWPTHQGRPTYLGIDRGCKVIVVLANNNNLYPPNGWLATTNIKVDPWHWNGHAVDDICVRLCNPNDRLNPNLVEIAPSSSKTAYRSDARGAHSRATAGRTANIQGPYKRLFNMEAAEHLNAYLEPFAPTMTKMKPLNHDLFLCIVLQRRANRLRRLSTPL